MTTSELVALLDDHMGKPMTHALAFLICNLADQLPPLVSHGAISRIAPEQYGEFTFAIERMEQVAEEVKPLHRAHWDETEGHRADLPFNPDYETFVRYERAGRYVLFTLRAEGRLLGNCAMYLNQSAHTQTLVATEDTLYLLPEARIGRTAIRFVGYVERALQAFGAREIDITVKTVNKAERFFRLLGYRHVENGLTKIIGDKSCAAKRLKLIH